MDFNKFKTIYYLNKFNNINMNLKIMQKMYIKCLIIDNKISNYSDVVLNLKKILKIYILYYQKNIVKKLLNEIKG